VKEWAMSSRGHAAMSMVLLLASQFFPQYAPLIQAGAGALGYGAAVMPAPVAAIAPKARARRK
jgi:hypothetical protein